MRLMRKAGIIGGGTSAEQTLPALFADMTYISGATRNSSTADNISCTYTATSAPRYVFWFRGNLAKISKMVGDTQTILWYQSTSNLTVSTENGITTVSAGTNRGGNMVVVEFPHYTEAQVDALLSGINLTRLAYRYQGSKASVSVTSGNFSADANHIQFACLSADTNDFSISMGDDYATPLFSAEGYAYTHFYKTTSYYYLSHDGTGSTTCYVGSIWEVTL